VDSFFISLLTTVRCTWPLLYLASLRESVVSRSVWTTSTLGCAPKPNQDAGFVAGFQTADRQDVSALSLVVDRAPDPGVVIDSYLRLTTYNTVKDQVNPKQLISSNCRSICFTAAELFRFSKARHTVSSNKNRQAIANLEKCLESAHLQSYPVNRTGHQGPCIPS